MQKTITLLLCALLFVAYFFDGFGFACLAHANIFHLICNIYALLVILNFPVIKRLYFTSLVMAFIVSALAFSLSPPAVGASGIVLALAAMVCVRNMCRRNFICIAALVLASFIPGMATEVHLYSLLFAFTFDSYRRYIQWLISYSKKMMQE